MGSNACSNYCVVLKRASDRPVIHLPVECIPTEREGAFGFSSHDSSAGTISDSAWRGWRGVSLILNGGHAISGDTGATPLHRLLQRIFKGQDLFNPRRDITGFTGG